MGDGVASRLNRQPVIVYEEDSILIFVRVWRWQRPPTPQSGATTLPKVKSGIRP